MQSSMQKIIKWKWRSTRKVGSGNTEQSNTSVLPASPTGRCILSIHECPLYLFIRVLCDRDFRALIIEGEVSEDLLQNAWQTIYQDYSDAVCGEHEAALIQMIRKIALLDFKIKKTSAIVTYLAFRMEPEYVKLLMHIGATDSGYPDTPTLQKSWWTRIGGRVKRWEQEMELEDKRLRDLQLTQQGSGDQTTRETFQDLIIQIEKYVRFNINERETTVGRFVAMVKDYQRYILALSKNKK